MVVLRLTSTKTLPILLHLLTTRATTQTSLARSTNSSIGRVNQVMQWLQGKDLITKEQGHYILTQPNRLADLIAAQQTITKKRTFYVNTTRQAAKASLTQHATLCMHSALEEHLKTAHDDALHATYTHEAEEYLQRLPRGELVVHLYEYAATTSDKRATSATRTIIDLKTIGKHQEADALAQTQWETRQ